MGEKLVLSTSIYGCNKIKQIYKAVIATAIWGCQADAESSKTFIPEDNSAVYKNRIRLSFSNEARKLISECKIKHNAVLIQ